MLNVETKNRLQKIFRIMVPIFVTQISIMGMNFSDTVMSGNASAVDLAGVAIGSNIWMPLFTGLSGVLVALTPIVAQLRGGGQVGQIGKAVLNGIYLALFLGIAVIVAGYFNLDRILSFLSLEPSVYTVARGYLAAIAWGIVPFFASIVLRSFVDSMGNTTLTMRLFLCTLPLNVAFNYVLIFGKLGLPALGGVGAGYGTSLTYWVVLGLFTLIIIRGKLLQGMGFAWQLPTLRNLQEHLLLGVPLGVSIFMETSVWGIVALFMAKFGTNTIAAHQTAINFSSLLYMLPLSFSMSLTILVGVEVGAKRYREAFAYAKTGIGANIALSLIFVVLLLVFREQIAHLYGAQGDILQLTVHFLAYAACFQLLDGTAAPMQGILRGYKDVNYAFFASLIAYWGVCLPCGYYLDVGMGQGANGYWQGLIVGIFCTAVFLGLRLVKVEKKILQKEIK